jgi:predicted GH43/DUF377 family glycosyl hydrolase
VKWQRALSHHSVFDTMDGAVYRVGVALHALEDPAKVIGGAEKWILAPEDPWELTGYVHNVVFCCDAVPEEGGTVKLYWGIAPWKAHEVRWPGMAAAVKLSQQPRTESCVVPGNGHCEA